MYTVYTCTCTNYTVYMYTYLYYFMWFLSDYYRMWPDQVETVLSRVAHSLVRDYSVHKVDVHVHCIALVYFHNKPAHFT